MILNIQAEILEYGLDAIVAKYSLICKDYGHKILLKYHQIDSRKWKTVPAVRECRGLILEKDSYAVMSMLFKRFFNKGESGEDAIDYNTARVFKKEDGSLIGLYFDWVLNDWAVQTSGTADANTPVNNDADLTFRNLFLKTITADLSAFNTDYIYAFELCTPYNIVVTPHVVCYTKVLTIRDRISLKELSWADVKTECARLGISFVDSYTFDAKNVTEIAKELPAVEEGYIVCDADFNRIKVKNPAYVVLHHLKGKTHKEDLFEILFKGESDEFLALMPEYTETVTLRTKFLSDIADTLSLIIDKVYDAPVDTKKVFAMWLQDELKNYSKVTHSFASVFYRWYAKRGTLDATAILQNVPLKRLEMIFTDWKFFNK